MKNLPYNRVDPFKITPGFTIYFFKPLFIERVPICSENFFYRTLVYSALSLNVYVSILKISFGFLPFP